MEDENFLYFHALSLGFIVFECSLAECVDFSCCIGRRKNVIYKQGPTKTSISNKNFPKTENLDFEVHHFMLPENRKKLKRRKMRSVKEYPNPTTEKAS